MRAVLVAALFATPAYAQGVCMMRDDITAQLAAGHSEALASGGIMSDNTMVIEVWASPGGETWTVLMTNAEGVSCIMAAGTDWHSRPALPVGALN